MLTLSSFFKRKKPIFFILRQRKSLFIEIDFLGFGFLDDPMLNAVEVFCDNAVVELPNVGDWVAITVTALYDPTHIWVNFPYGIDLFKGNQG